MTPEIQEGESIMTPEIQEGFDILFPEHKGHEVKGLSEVSHLCFKFICSCGEEIVFTNSKYTESRDNEKTRAFIDYFTKLYNCRQQKLQSILRQAAEFGFTIIKIKTLFSLINREAEREVTELREKE